MISLRWHYARFALFLQLATCSHFYLSLFQAHSVICEVSKMCEEPCCFISKVFRLFLRSFRFYAFMCFASSSSRNRYGPDCWYFLSSNCSCLRFLVCLDPKYVVSLSKSRGLAAPHQQVNLQEGHFLLQKTLRKCMLEPIPA